MAKIDAEKVPLKTLSKLYAISDRAVYSWVERGCPRNPDGSFSLEKVLPWRSAMSDRTAQGAHADLARIRAEHETLKSEITSVRLEKLRGEVVSATEAQCWCEREIIAARNLLLRIPSACAVQLARITEPREIAEVLEDRIREALDMLASRAPDMLTEVRYSEADVVAELGEETSDGQGEKRKRGRPKGSGKKSRDSKGVGATAEAR